MTPHCIGCGCTENRACAMPDGEACWWTCLNEDTGKGLCSACAVLNIAALVERVRAKGLSVGKNFGAEA